MAYRPVITNILGLSGDAESGGLLYSYVRGTSTPLGLYSDAGVTPETNPVEADSIGQITAYFNEALEYSWRAKTADAATTLWEADVVSGVLTLTYVNPAFDVFPLIEASWLPALGAPLGEDWARWLASRPKPGVVWAEEFGADPAASAAVNQAAFMDAHDFIVDEFGEGVVKFGKGRFKLGEQMDWNGLVTLEGIRTLSSALYPDTGFSVSDSVIRVVGTGEMTGLRFRNFMIGNPTGAGRLGAHGIHLDTTVAGRIHKMLLMQGVHIVDSENGYAFWHQNDEGLNGTGALFKSAVMDCYLGGGVLLTDTGDNLAFLRNGCDSEESAFFQGSQAAGAANLLIADNNSGGCKKGLITFTRFRNLAILRNQYEQTVTLSQANLSLVDLNCNPAVQAGVHPKIEGNLFTILAATSVSNAIRLRGTHGAHVAPNTIGSALAGVTGVEANNANNTDPIIERQVRTSSNVSPVVSAAAAVGLIGYPLAVPTLQNGWANFGGGTDPLLNEKTREGKVHIYGSIKNADVAQAATGKLLFTLASHMRPSTLVYRFVYVAGYGPGLVKIDTDGTVKVEDFNNLATKTIFDIWLDTTDLANADI